MFSCNISSLNEVGNEHFSNSKTKKGKRNHFGKNDFSVIDKRHWLTGLNLFGFEMLS